MTEKGTDSAQEASEENPSIQRRDVLKATSAAAVGLTAATGVASATDKGVSWVAFCGCDSTPCIRFIKQQDDDESVTELAYSNENCDHVYYKLGQEVREDNSGGTVDVGSPYIINTDEPDPVVSGNDSAVNRDPCGELSSTTGTKFDVEEDLLDEDGNLKDEFACPD